MDNGYAPPYPWLNVPLHQLSQTWQSGRFHHALLLGGQQGTGKSALASFMAKGIVCKTRNDLSACGQCKSCLLFNAGNHPDCRVLNKDNQTIGVDAIRQAQTFVYQKSQISPQRVLLIHHAQKLTEEAANALLKTLEEPCANVYIVLCTDNPTQLLPTVRSRCFKMIINATDKVQVYQWLLGQYVSADNPLSQSHFEQLYALSNNAPLRVLRWLEEGKLPDVAQLTQDFGQWLEGTVSSVDFKSKLMDNDFALLLFHHLTIAHVRTTLVNASGSPTEQQFIAVQQIFAQISQFGRDGLTILGQNKSLALLKLLNQLQSKLKG